MEYKIIDKEGFPVVGKSIRVSTKDGENYRRIPEFWTECHENGVCKQICEQNPVASMLGICMEYSPEQDEFTYLIGVEKANGPVPAGMVESCEV